MSRCAQVRGELAQRPLVGEQDGMSALSDKSRFDSKVLRAGCAERICKMRWVPAPDSVQTRTPHLTSWSRYGASSLSS